MAYPAGNMEVFSAAVHVLHTAGGAVVGLEAMLPVVAELFGARHALIDSLSYDRSAAQVLMALNREEIADALELYPQHVEGSLTVQLLRTGGFSPVTRLSDHYGASELTETPFYRAIFQPAGWKDQLGIVVKLPERALRVTLYRNSSFTDDEVRVAVLLQKHIVARFQGETLAAPNAEQGSDWELPLASESCVQLMPGTARKLLQAYFGHKEIDGNGLPGEIQAWIKRVRGGKAGSQHPFASEQLRVSRPCGCLRLKLRDCMPRGPCGVLCLREELGRHDFYRLRALGLTDREIEVIFWVAQGKADAETAIILGAARKTISKHVENILIKFAAENRTSAAIKAVQWLIDPSEDVRSV
jgi:DNA-binding CsgD family transcriptional regulator